MIEEVDINLSITDTPTAVYAFCKMMDVPSFVYDVRLNACVCCCTARLSAVVDIYNGGHGSSGDGASLLPWQPIEGKREREKKRHRIREKSN